MFEQLQNTLGQSLQAPPQSNPLGASPEVAQLFASGDILAQSTPAAGAFASVSSDIAAEARKQAAAAKAAAENQASGKGWKKVPKEDGGFDFFDALGNPVTAKEYARAKGQNLDKVLGDSENSLDRQFLRDYKQTQEFAQALEDDDVDFLQGRIDDILADETLDTQEKRSRINFIRNATPEMVGKSLMKTYPQVFETGGGAGRIGQRVPAPITRPPSPNFLDFGDEFLAEQEGTQGPSFFSRGTQSPVALGPNGQVGQENQGLFFRFLRSLQGK